MSAPAVDRLFAAMRSSKGFSAAEKTVTSVITSLGEGNNDQRDLVPHIIEDFALTHKVLKLANSAMYAPFSQGADSVSSALDILGADALMHLVLGTTMVSDAELKNDNALTQTLLASELARSVAGSRTEDVSVASLMYNLGGMMLKKYLPTEAATIERKVASGMAQDEASTSVLGMTMQAFGAELAQRWKFPTPIVSIIDGTGDPSLIAIAKFSSAASALICAGKSGDVGQLIAELDVPSSHKSGISALVQSQAERFKGSPLVMKKSSSEDVLSDLFATLAQDKRQNVEALAAAMFPTFSEVLKAAHCLLFMQTKSGDFAVRYGHGKGIDELRSKLRVSKDYKPTAFHAAIKNNVDVSIADVSRLKTTALPDNYTALLPNVNKFVILPIANSGVSGLVYCDWDTETLLSPTELEAVKRLRGLFLPYFPA